MKQLLSSNLMKYLIAGGSNTVISLMLYYLLLKIGINYLVDNVICFVVGVLLGYTLNTIFVFRNKLHFKSLIKYSLVYVSSLSLNIVMLFSLVHYLDTDKMLAQVITTGFVTIANYLLIKKLVFK